jgi:hypothetical protein
MTEPSLSPDFAALEGIKAALHSLPLADLADLVAVFSQTAGNRLLLVYNSDKLPSPLASHLEAIPLTSLVEAELQSYDGLFVGISALDVMRPDLLTKGPGFYPLDRLLLNLGQRQMLYHTLHNLAHSLVAFMANLPEDAPLCLRRAGAKAIQLALPSLLMTSETKDLVAVLPGSDLRAFVHGKSGCFLRVSDDWEALGEFSEGSWILAFENLAYFYPRIRSTDRFIELRDVLRWARLGDGLEATCRNLARRCMIVASDDSAAASVAWALMTEAWLSAEDAEDLVAYFPYRGFDQFAETGNALRVYRALASSEARASREMRCPLDALNAKRLPEGYGAPGYALFPLAELPLGQTAPLSDNLGAVLWRAGHKSILPRTLWALAQDELERATLGLSSQTVSDLARRAVILIGLGDPWPWRQGRYAQMVDEAYLTLGQALLRQAKAAPETTRDYHRALVDWYGLAETGEDELESKLRDMAGRLRTFRRVAHDLPERSFRSFTRDAEQLTEIEQTALYPYGGTDPTGDTDKGIMASFAADERWQILYDAARQPDTKHGISTVSPVFERAWRTVVDLRRKRQQVLMYERNPDAEQHKLEALLIEFRKMRRTVALPHEATVLRLVCDREIAEIEKHLSELRIEARLQIAPLSPYLEMGRPVTLHFEINNAGRVEAINVDLVLSRGRTFELLDHSSVREFPALPPGAPQRLEYRVRVTDPGEAVFDFQYTHAGIDRPQELHLRLPVRTTRESPFTTKANPYKVGRAIQSPKDFYGREDEMRQLMGSLYSGGHADFLLRGPRRMGKTSMLHMIEQALLSPELRRQFVIPPEWDAILDRCIPVRLDLQGFVFTDDRSHVTRFFFVLLDGVSTALVPDLRSELLAGYEAQLPHVDPQRAVLEQLRRAFRERPQARVVVLLDEYDEIYRPEGRALDTALRYVVQEEQRLTWVIASTQFLFKEGKSYGSPWFNILNIVELGCLSRRAAWHLVEDPSRRESVEWQSDAIVALLDESGCHPFFLQLFGSRVIAYLNQESQNFVSPETVATLAEEIVAERETVHSHFEFFWADTPGVGQLILLAADASKHPPTRLDLLRQVRSWLEERCLPCLDTAITNARGEPVSWWEQAFEDGMAWVVNVVNALSFDRASRAYSFTVPLFRRWLQRKTRYEDLREAALSKASRELDEYDGA